MNGTPEDRDNFSHAIPRRLSAEELMDAVSSAAERVPISRKFLKIPMPRRSWIPHVGQDGFLDVLDVRRVNRPVSANAAATSACRRP